MQDNKTWFNRLFSFDRLEEKVSTSLPDGFNDLILAYNTIPFLRGVVKPINVETTQFVDVSSIVEDFNYAEKISGEITSRIDLRSTGNAHFCIILEKFQVKSIELPFEEGFYKIHDENTTPTKSDFMSSFIYIREHTPEYFEGILFIRQSEYVPVPFTITLEENYFLISSAVPCPEAITKNKEMLEEYKMDALTRVRCIFAPFFKLERLNHKDTVYRYSGVTSKQKYKVNGKKSFLRKNVYVYLNKEQEIPRAYNSFKLQRETSWKVRGHWRRLANVKEGTIGKDGRGIRDTENPILKKWTWVKEHMCGTGENFQPRTLVVKEGK